MPMSIKVSGLAEARQAFRILTEQIPNRVQPACVAAMKPMLAKVLAEAPKATGALAAKIELKEGKPKRGRARVGVVMAGVRYGAFVALGTKRRDANDFFQRAFSAEGEKTADRAVEGILGSDFD